MAISYFGAASNPADNANPAANNNGVYTVTPPGSMTTGDLCILISELRVIGANDVCIAVGGNQTWTEFTAQTGAAIKTQMFWARFDGTWVEDPGIQFRSMLRGGMIAGCGASTGDTTFPLTAVMLVFRPTDTAKIWEVDVAHASTTYAAPSTPFTVTRTGVTTVTNAAVAIAAFGSADDNTWGTIAGAGWVQIGTQWRNLAGSDMSLAAAYKLMPTLGATGNVSLNQATNGGDAGTTHIVAFREV